MGHAHKGRNAYGQQANALAAMYKENVPVNNAGKQTSHSRCRFYKDKFSIQDFLLFFKHFLQKENFS